MMHTLERIAWFHDDKKPEQPESFELEKADKYSSMNLEYLLVWKNICLAVGEKHYQELCEAVDMKLVIPSVGKLGWFDNPFYETELAT